MIGDDVLGRRLEEHRPLFGRESELARAVELLESIRAGTGRILLFEGEAGIGKSHLARAIEAEACRRSLQVVCGAADELQVSRPGHLLRLVIRALGATADGGSDRTDALLTLPSYTLVETCIDTLENAAAISSVVLVLDDLQWADGLSVRGIGAIARRIGSLPVAVVGSMRPVPRSAALQQLLEVCRHAGAEPVRLASLGPDAVVELVRCLFGASPSPSLRAWLQRAAGNPLYVTELLRALADDEALVVTDGQVGTDVATVPRSLARTLTTRLESMPDTTQELLRLASLLGSDFALSDLAVVANLAAVEVASHLRVAFDAAFLAGGGDRLVYRHDLIREAVYLDIPAAVRRDLHTAAGRALAAAGAPSIQVARQFASGAPVGDPSAIRWLLRAADDTVQLDTATAASLTERALQFAPAGWDRRAEVEASLVELLAWSGRVDDARVAGEALLRRSLTATERARAHRAMGSLLSTIGGLDGAAEQLTAAADAPVVAANEQAAMRCAAAGMRIIVGQPPSEARAVAASAARDDDRRVACWAQHTLGIAAIAEGAYDAALEAFERASAMLDAGYVAPLGFLLPHIGAATCRYHVDDFPGVDRAIAAARHRGERRGDVALLAQTTATETVLAWVTGRWDDATTHADATLALADETAQHVQAVLIHAILALIALGRGDRATANAHLAEGNTVIEAGSFHLFGFLLWVQAQALEADGRAEVARLTLDGMWRHTVHLRGASQWRSIGPDLVRLSRETGDLGGARKVAHDMEELAARSRSRSAAAASLRARGLADADPDPLVAAVEILRSTPRVLDTAATGTEAAALLPEQGRKAEATVMLDEAAHLYGRVGAEGFLERIDQLARHVGRARQPRRHTNADFGWESLSEKEREVVELVADGLSNPQIAERLYISRRTVESHVSHVFRKLGFSNRTQLATAATRRTAETPGREDARWWSSSGRAAT